jgi:glutamate dehydrogenase/leucine dehydrogenase
VLAIPDFVANCGGVLGSSMSRGGLSRDRIASIVARRVGGEAERLFAEAAEEERSLRSVATELALKRFHEAKMHYEGRSPGRTLTRAVVAAYRRGLLPRSLLAPAAGWYYDSRWR